MREPEQADLFDGTPWGPDESAHPALTCPSFAQYRDRYGIPQPSIWLSPEEKRAIMDTLWEAGL